MATWDIRAFPILGDGKAYPAVATELDLENATVTEKLNAPAQITGTLLVTEELTVGGMKAGRWVGDLAIGKWRTEVVATLGSVVVGGIVVNDNMLGGGAGMTRRMELDVMGYSGYANEFPYMQENYYTDVDPAGLVSRVWQVIQKESMFDASLGSNIGLKVWTQPTTVRLGKAVTPVTGKTGLGEDYAFDEGKVKLTPWDVSNCGEFLRKLCEETPMDFVERCKWDSSNGQLIRELLYAPRHGRRRTDITFRVGEAVVEWPDIEENGDEYANHIMAFGRGEGKQAVRVRLSTAKQAWKPHFPDRWGANGEPLPPIGLARFAVWTDKTKYNVASLTAAARAELARRAATTKITGLTVRDHPHAPLGSYSLGDEVQVWLDIDEKMALPFWVRIMGRTWNVGQSSVKLEVETL